MLIKTLKEPNDTKSLNKHKTIRPNEQSSLQIDLFTDQPKKKIKHNLLSNDLINLQSVIHSSKSNIYKKYYDNKLKPTLTPLLKNLNLIYKSTNYNKNKIPVSITLEDFDRNNNDPNYYFDKQHKKYQTKVSTLGYTARIGHHDDNNLYINKLTIHANMYDIPIILHEIAHAIDMSSHPKFKNYMSDTIEFKPIMNLYQNEINQSNLSLYFNKDYIEYLKEPTEIFARFYSSWYDIEIQRYSKNKSVQNIFNPLDKDNHIPLQMVIGEKIAYDLYEKHPEIQQFFTKHFGGIIPPENTKLFNKEKWDDLHTESTSPSDTSLLKKLSNIMSQTGLSQKEQPSNNIDLDY